MEFHYTGPQTEFENLLGGYFYINAIGPIEHGDERKFSDFLRAVDPPPRATVYIDSSGGNVEAAIAIGRDIRDFWFSTAIGRYVLEPTSEPSSITPRKLIPGRCMSAATLIYLGGRLRYFSQGSTFGVHQFSFQNPSPEDVGRSQVLSAKIATFVADMRVSPAFLEISSSTPSNSINNVNVGDLKRLGVVTGGITEVEWSVQAKNQIMYVRGMRDSLFGHHKVMLCYGKGAGFLFWAVIESLGRERELTEFGLVEIAINREDERIDISSRCEREVEGIYVNVLSRISEDEARAIALSESFGIQIRSSNKSPIFLGISAMSTQGGKDQLQTFFHTFSDSAAAFGLGEAPGLEQE